MKEFVLLLFLVVLLSCDTSTHVYYTYESGQTTPEGEGIYFGWDVNSECYISFDDPTLVFDNVDVTFPSNNLIISSYRESYYDYEYSDSLQLRTKIDSTLRWSYGFHLTENDSLVLANDSILVDVKLGDLTIRKETLYRKKHEIKFIDRLPIPKMH